ncbi:LPXTG cell wall anchor domain-containing protein [Staphylococcus petrasii]|nr:LPXTG cell wall anchor domain-containing protein [Staphylococcus petrasii]
MKKVGILATSALAGTLLFAGTGHAQAASQISSHQAEDEVASYIQNSNTYHKMPESGVFAYSEQETFSPVENSYAIGFGQVGDNGPTYLYVNKSTGTIYDGFGNVLQQGALNQNDANSNNQQNGENTQTTTHDNQTTPNSSQQTNANTTSNAQSSQDNSTTTAQTSQDNSTTTAQDTNHSTSQTTPTKALPETGETSNSGLVTTIAAVLLAAGSLLVFRRKSTTK